MDSIPKSSAEVPINFTPGYLANAPSPFVPDAKLKKRIRQLRFTVRCLDLLCSLFIVISLGHALRLFNASLPLQNSLNSQDPNAEELWPTGVNANLQTFLLSVAVLSFLLNLSVLVAYLFSHRAATLAGRGLLVFEVVTAVVFLALFSSATGLLQAIKSGQLNFENHPNSYVTSCQSWYEQSPVDYRAICWSTDWAVGCGWVSAILSFLTIVLLSTSFFRRLQKHIITRHNKDYATAENVALRNYHAHGVQKPGLASAMVKTRETAEISQDA